MGRGLGWFDLAGCSVSRAKYRSIEEFDLSNVSFFVANKDVATSFGILDHEFVEFERISYNLGI